MSVISALIDPSFLADLLSDKSKSDLAQKIIVVMIVYLVMGRQVNAHFKALESKLDQLVGSFHETKAALTERLNQMDDRVKKLEND